MKLPEYILKEEHFDGEDKLEAYSKLLPIWNEDFLPEHLKEALEKAERHRFDREKMVMCNVGKRWYAIPKFKIRVY